MKSIYLSHSKNFDFVKELYIPLRVFSKTFSLILPHESEHTYIDTKELFSKNPDISVLAEVSIPSTGQGMELGYAKLLGLKVICFYKKGSKPSDSVVKNFSICFEYFDESDLILKLQEIMRMD